MNLAVPIDPRTVGLALSGSAFVSLSYLSMRADAIPSRCLHAAPGEWCGFLWSYGAIIGSLQAGVIAAVVAVILAYVHRDYQDEMNARRRGDR